MTFFLSKALWVLARPSNLLLLIACLGSVLSFTSRARVGRNLVAMVLGCFVLIAFLPVGSWLLFPLENRFAIPEMPARVDGIILLSGAFQARNSAYRGQPQLNKHAGRFTKFLELARKYPDAKLVFSGGAVRSLHGGVTESDIGRWFFAAQGLDPQRILFEDKSRNTHENVINSKKLAQPREGENWLLVTSASHMPRAVGLFRRNGWKVIPFPAGYQSAPFLGGVSSPDFGRKLVRLDDAVREWTGLTAYYFLGRTSAIFPGPE